MCFSATASFAAATATGLAGAFAVRHVTGYREAPLGAIPLVFAAQQAVEGGLWLTLEHRWPAFLAPVLANAFVACALVVWPLLAPYSLLLVERDSRRRAAMVAMFLAGVVVAAYAALDIAHHPYVAQPVGASLCYVNNSPFPPPLVAAYAFATCAPALVSSHAALRVFGGIVVLGGLLSIAFYFVAFLSVWCFFAAAASVAIGAHFARGAERVASPRR